MKKREVEYFRLWEDHSWDTDYIHIPADTPDDKLDEAVRTAAATIPWVNDTPVLVGHYHSPSPEDEVGHDDGPLICDECGEPFSINEGGVNNHIDEEAPDGIDHDADRDHVPYHNEELD